MLHHCGWLFLGPYAKLCVMWKLFVLPLLFFPSFFYLLFFIFIFITFKAQNAQWIQMQLPSQTEVMSRLFFFFFLRWGKIFKSFIFWAWRTPPYEMWNTNSTPVHRWRNGGHLMAVAELCWCFSSGLSSLTGWYFGYGRERNNLKNLVSIIWMYLVQRSSNDIMVSKLF